MQKTHESQAEEVHEVALDSRNVLTEALKMVGTSKSAFARVAGMNAPDLGRYLKEGGPVMGVDKMHRVLEANGLRARVVLERIDEQAAHPAL